MKIRFLLLLTFLSQLTFADVCIEAYEKFQLQPPSHDPSGKETEYYKMGTYNRISPEGRFVLMTSSGAGLGSVTLVHLNREANQKIHTARPERTPLNNEAFATLSSFRFLVSTGGDHYTFKNMYIEKDRARSSFKVGETGFYAAATEVVEASSTENIKIRSLAWPNAEADSSSGSMYSSQTQGVGELNSTLAYISRSGDSYKVTQTKRSTPLCKNIQNTEGRIFNTPMISVEGNEFSAVPINPRRAIIDPKTRQVISYENEAVKAPRIYKIINENGDCERVMDFEYDIGKLTFGYPIAQGKPAPLIFNGSGTRISESCINFTKDLEFEMNEQIRIQDEYNKQLRQAQLIYDEQMRVYYQKVDEIEKAKKEQLEKDKVNNSESSLSQTQENSRSKDSIMLPSRNLPDQRYKPGDFSSTRSKSLQNEQPSGLVNTALPPRPVMKYPTLKVPPKKYDARNIVERDGVLQHCTVHTITTRGLHYVDRSVKDHVFKKPKTFQILPTENNFQSMISATGFAGMTKDGRVIFPARWIEYKREKRVFQEPNTFKESKKNEKGMVILDEKGEPVMEDVVRTISVEREVDIPYDKFGFVKVDPFQSDGVRDYITSYHGLKEPGITTKSCVTKNEVLKVEKEFNIMVGLPDLKLSY